MTKPHRTITREKHLDHLVKVVPVIVFGYALQCYILSAMGPIALGVNTLIFLGIALGAMIGAFITYDLKHQVEFFEDHFTIRFSFLKRQEVVSYSEIAMLEASDEEQNFSHFIIRTRQGKKYKFYFVDDAPALKKWLSERQLPQFKAA
jgi:hypothetical protein